MDAKITKLRLSRMLSYDWLKIVFTAAALVVVWLLVFTMTATAIAPSQKFNVLSYVGNNALSDGELHAVNARAMANGVFSYEVIESSAEDLSISADMAGELLQARLTVEDTDVIFVADYYDTRDIEMKEIEGSDGEYEYQFGDTYLTNFLQGYFVYVYDVQEYLDEMRAFVARYYENGDYASPSELNEQKIKDDFNARTKKDKRFKKSSARAKGEKGEIERIQKYRDTLVKFEWYLKEGVVSLTETLLAEEYFKDGSDLKGVYSINLCPTLAKGGMTIEGKPAMSNLLNAVSYKTVDYDDEGALIYGENSVDNMNICLFKTGNGGAGFQYENLSYVVYLIDEYVHSQIKDECHQAVYA